jgi:hypothetical protein
MNQYKDTWNSHPKHMDYVGQIEVTHEGGFNHSEMGVPCFKGEVAQFVLYPDNPDRDFGFNWYRKFAILMLDGGARLM